MPETPQPPRAPLAHFFPILRWLPAYQSRWWRADFFAGLTLWGILVPEAIAHAIMAGAALQAGLYTLLASLAVYVVLGPSRQLSQRFHRRLIHHDGRGGRPPGPGAA